MTVKRLIVGLATLLCAIGAAWATGNGSSNYCPDFSNDWTAPNEGTGTGNYIIHAIQAPNGSGGFLLEGAVDGFYCGEDGTTRNYTIDNTVSRPMGNGQFYIVAYANPQTKCTYFATWDIPLATWGCATAVISSPGNVYPSPAVASCLVPHGAPTTGELQTTWSQWLPALPGLGVFEPQLNDPVLDGTTLTNYNWVGRRVQESFSNQSNTCVGLAYPTPKTNDLTSTGLYDDDVGFTQSNAAMGQIRVSSGSPCQISQTQTMSIDCQSASPQYSQYEQHSMLLEILTSTVHVERNSVPSANPTNQPYGWTAAGWLSSPGISPFWLMGPLK